MKFREYAGINCEQASREASRLIQKYGWFNSWEKLEELRNIIRRDR